MNTPIPFNPSTNQWRNYVLGYTNQLTDEKSTWIESVKKDFKTSLNYFPVNKNLDTSKFYDCWIYDGNRDQKLLGNKEFVSYPYDTVIFDIGDYIGFTYGDEYENWLITSIDKTQLYNVSGKLERCVADLKWVDNNGKLQSYPCALKDMVTRGTPDFSKSIIIPQGYITVTVQQNDDTNLITKNMRFLFGVTNNYTPFRIVTVNNFSKTKSITFEMRVDSIAPEDDIVNGIAKNTYNIAPSPTPSGKSYILSPTSVVSQDSSNNKLYYGTVNQGTDNEQTFAINAYNNGIVQSDTFTIAVSSQNTVPNSNYTLTVVDGNTFKILNNQEYMDSKLIITCTDNIDNTVIELDVLLGGEF